MLKFAKRNIFTIMRKLLLKYLNTSAGILPYCLVFIASISGPVDPDLGWHLKYGEYLVKHHDILRANTFSTMMPDYRWANTSWLTDLLSYLTYQAGGFFGLILLSSFTITLTFYFLSKALRLSLWDQAILFPILIYLELPLNDISFRGQELTFLFLSILIFLINYYERHAKLIFLTIPLFLVWANFHGEFLLGLTIFAGWIVLYLLQGIFINLKEAKYRNITNKSYLSLTIGFLRFNKKGVIYLISVLIFSFLAILINPFGIEIYTDIFSHIGNPLLKDILEYIPIAAFSDTWWNHVTVLLLAIIGLLILRAKNQLISPIFIGILLVFLYAFKVIRYAWASYYLILPVLQIVPAALSPKGKQLNTTLSVLLLSVAMAIMIAVKLPAAKYTSYSWSSYCQRLGCSPKSAEYLIKHNLTRNLFSLYGWGGWLIWNYPRIKPLIDGRMHLWQDRNGYSAFAEYYDYQTGKKSLDSSPYKVVYISRYDEPYNDLLILTLQKKWKMIYQDDSSAIFVRGDK